MSDALTDGQRASSAMQNLREFLLALRDCFALPLSKSADGGFEKAHKALLKLSPGHLYAFCRHEPDQEAARGRDINWFKTYLGSLHYGDVTGAERWRQLLFFIDSYDAVMYFNLKVFSPFAGKTLIFASLPKHGVAVLAGKNRDLQALIARQPADGEYVITVTDKAVTPVRKR